MGLKIKCMRISKKKNIFTHDLTFSDCKINFGKHIFVMETCVNEIYFALKVSKK